MSHGNNHLVLNMDAFSDGQIRSKLWLCEKLEKLPFASPQKLWIYGSWYGILALLLLTRQAINLERICFFDLDEEALEASRKILNTWEIRGPVVRFYKADCTKISPRQNDFKEPVPDIIVNTSCEHFENREWLDKIPEGTTLALQSTDMPHKTHIQSARSLEEFKRQCDLSSIQFAGELEFTYPNSHFLRFMLIGKK